LTRAGGDARLHPYDLAPGEHEAALRRCESAGLVLAAADAWRFSHVLIRDRLVATMPPERRRAQHARLSRRLAVEAERGRAPWSEVALHASAAGDDPALAHRAWLRAGEQALAELAGAEALEAFARADARGADGATRVGSWIGRGRALAATARPEEARQAWRRALDIARDAGEPSLVAEASLALGELYHFVHVDQTLVEALARALEGLPAGECAARPRDGPPRTPTPVEGEPNPSHDNMRRLGFEVVGGASHFTMAGTRWGASATA
jgi:tetratricopeptide (TPR) repeat protein